MRVTEQMDEPVAQYLRLYFCLFQTTVRRQLTSAERRPCTVAQNLVVLRHPIIHFPTSLGVSEWAKERMSAVECASEARSVEHANERTEEPLAQ